VPSKSTEPDDAQRGPQDSFQTDIEANHLIKEGPPSSQARLIERLVVKPGEQPRIALGNFTEHNTPKGFSIEINPDPHPAGSVITQVTSLGTTKRYKLLLLIANYGTKTITAEVRQL